MRALDNLPEELAPLLYQALLKNSHTVNPSLWPLGLLEWDRLPSLSKEYLRLSLLDALDALDKNHH